MWQNVVKQEVAFCACVKDVVTKHAKKSGFDGIYRAFREMKKWDARRRNLKAMIRKFETIMRASGFTYIKYSNLTDVDQRDREF